MRQALVRVFSGEPPSRPAASSGGTDQEGEAKRVRFNVLDNEESDGWVETEEEWCESTVVPDESKRESPLFASLMEERRLGSCRRSGWEAQGAEKACRVIFDQPSVTAGRRLLARRRWDLRSQIAQGRWEPWDLSNEENRREAVGP